jgi:dynein heavy chain
MMYPVMYEESMNTVLIQELQKFNRLLGVMKRSLFSVQKALKGLVVMSAELDAMGTAIFDQKVPGMWESVAYPSLMPLGAWTNDLIARLDFYSTWVTEGIPPIFWISAFFFPQAFMTGTLQNFARKHSLPIDTVANGFKYLDDDPTDIEKKPDDGCYIRGLFCEGARWSAGTGSLEEPLPKELFSTMPVIHLSPEQDRPITTEGIYRCPVYKILTRTGTLSTTGHSTNFVFWMEIPSRGGTCYRQSLVSETNANIKLCDNADWVRAGVACFCSLRF